MEVVEGRADVADVGIFVSELEAIGEEYGITVQVFDARYVVDRDHLRRAVEVACRERARGEAIASDPGVEILLYAAGRRQINRAMEMGVKSGDCPVVAVVVDCDAHDWREADREHRPTATTAERRAGAAVDDLLVDASSLGDPDEELVRSFFDVTDRELAATDGDLADLVRERVALLVVER